METLRQTIDKALVIKINKLEKQVTSLKREQIDLAIDMQKTIIRFRELYSNCLNEKIDLEFELAKKEKEKRELNLELDTIANSFDDLVKSLDNIVIRLAN